MKSKRMKVAVTGAAGQIGYALVYRIAAGEMFGPDTEVELQLLELEPALKALEGVAMELDDCAFPLLKNIVITSQTEKAFNGINWALLVGAAPRKAGMERNDLIQVNGGIFAPQGKALNKVADKNVKTLVVGNPCNTNALIAMKNAPDVPSQNFYAMTMLDQNRAKIQLAKKTNTDLKFVKKIAIWGNHSATQFPNYFHAEINGKKATDLIKDTAWFENDFVPCVQKRGAAIIAARGASSAASAANAIIDTVRNVENETPAGDYYSVGQLSKGQYGIKEEVIFSFPTITKGGKAQIVEGLTLSAQEKSKIDETYQELLQEKSAVKNLL